MNTRRKKKSTTIYHCKTIHDTWTMRWYKFQTLYSKHYPKSFNETTNYNTNKYSISSTWCNKVPQNPVGNSTISKSASERYHLTIRLEMVPTQNPFRKGVNSESGWRRYQFRRRLLFLKFTLATLIKKIIYIME